MGPETTHHFLKSPGRSFFDLSVSGRSLAASESPGPLNKKQKQSAVGAILWPKLLETGGLPCILVIQTIVQPSHHSIGRPDRPSPSTTQPAHRPTTSHRLPSSLSTRPECPRAPGSPLFGPLFSCFLFLFLLAHSQPLKCNPPCRSLYQPAGSPVRIWRQGAPRLAKIPP